MSDQTLTVNAGPAQTVGANLANGYLIRNLSTSTKVWVSSDPGVQSGYGQPIGPLGSLIWNGGPCYAILDASTGSASLVLSTNTQQVVDPVSVAQALNLSTSLTGFGNNAPVSVQGLGSVSGNIQIPGAGYLVVTFLATSANFASVVYERIYTFPNALSQWYFTTPVYGPYLQLQWVGAGTPTFNYIYGTNQALPPDVFTKNGASGSLNMTYPTGLTVIGQNIASRGGVVTIRVAVATALVTAGGEFGIQYYDTTQNAISNISIVNSKQLTVDEGGNNVAYINGVSLPAGSFQCFWYNAGAATAGLVTWNALFN